MNEMTLIEVPAGTSLATIDTLVPEKVFAPGGIKAAVTALKTEVRAQAASLDISTEKGRKQIASLAYKVAQSKTALDKIGKDLTADWQRQTNLVNEDRRYLRDEMDALKDEVRKPLDEYIAEEAKRVAAHEAALAEIEILASVDGLSAEQINERIWKVPSIDGRPWQEFRTRAERVTAVTLERLQGARAIAVQLEEAAAQAEQERLDEIERQRVAGHERALAEIAELAQFDVADELVTSPHIHGRLAMLKRLPVRDWQDFVGRADEARRTAADRLAVLLTAAGQREAVEKAAREAKIAADAAEAAKQEAEAKAERERQTAAKALAEAEGRRQKAEADRIAAEQRAETERRANLTSAIEWMDKALDRINPAWEIAHQISHIDSTLTRITELMGEHDWRDMADDAADSRGAATERLTERRGKLAARQTEIDAATLAKTEAERIARHERALESLQGMFSDACSPFNGSDMIRHITKILDGMSELKRDWQEYRGRADALIAEGRQRIADRLAVVLEQEEDRRKKLEQQQADEAKRREEDAAAAATLAEQKRVAAKELADKAAAERLAKNVAHRKRIERDVLADMIQAMADIDITIPAGEDADIGTPIAKAILSAIAAGKVRHTTIGYGSAA